MIRDPKIPPWKAYVTTTVLWHSGPAGWTARMVLASILVSTQHGPEGYEMDSDGKSPQHLPHAHRSATNAHGCILISTTQFTAGSQTRGPPSSWLSLFLAPGSGPVPSIPHASVKIPEVLCGKVKTGLERERENL